MAVQFTDKTAKEAIASGAVTVIDFWATWCGPCIKLGEVIEQLAEKYEGKVTVGKINVEEETEICAEYKVRNIPTVLFIKDGEVKSKSVGLVSLADLESKLQPLL